MKKILGICGSASQNSSNLSILKTIGKQLPDDYRLIINDGLHELPHFQTELTDKNTPEQIIQLRNRIADSDAVLISTPEYIFSIPARLKNVLEWCVSTMVFSEKPVGIITASAHGKSGHGELIHILNTIQARLDDTTMLLIQGVKGKINDQGEITHKETMKSITNFAAAFIVLIEKSYSIK